MKRNLFHKKTWLLIPLLFALGIASLWADTPSTPVSVMFSDAGGIPQVNGEVNGNPVSVGFSDAGGTPQVNGEINGSKPVSVGFSEGSGVPVVNGEINGRAVSVFFSEGGGVPSISGEINGRPISTAFQPDNVLDPDLVGLWHMDGDWTDSSGNNNHGMPANGVAFSANAKIGTQAGSFDGVDDYVSIPSTDFNIAGQLSIEAWIYADVNNLYRQWIFSHEDTNSPNGSFDLVLYDPDNTSPYINVVAGQFKDANGWHLVSGQTPIATGVWYHVVFTYDGSKLRLYLNGQPNDNGGVSYAGSIPALTASSTIGKLNLLSPYYWDGLIDEVAIYKRALTAEEIAMHYSAGISDPNAPASPVLNPVPSSVGTTTITLSGTKTAGASIWVNNKKIVSLDDLTTWQGIYGTLQPGFNLLNIVAADASYRQSKPVSVMVFYDNQPPTIESSDPANNSDTAKPVTSVAINLADNYSAINLGASIEGATVKNSSNQLISGSWNTFGAKTVIFTPSSPFPQDTYTVTIYPVDSAGNRGMQQIVFKTFDTTPPVTKVGLSGTKGSDGWYSTPVTVTLTADDGARGSGIDRIEYSTDGTTWTVYGAQFVIDQDGITTLYYRAIDKAGNIESVKSQEIKINKTGLVALYHMDNNWLDSSLMANHGTAYNGATFSPSAKIGTHAGSFDGVDDYVKFAASSMPTTNRTFELWFYTEDASVPIARQIFGYGGNSNNPPYSSFISTLSSDAKTITFHRHYPGGDILSYTHPTALTFAWHHLAFTSNANGSKIYLDGQLVASNSTVISTYVSGKDGFIGALPSGSGIGTYVDPNYPYFKGRIDEVAIYNRALSDIEIQEHYRNYVVTSPTVVPVQSPTTSSVITLSGSKPADTAIVVNGVTLIPMDSLQTWQGAYTLQPGMNNLSITAMDSQGFHSQPVIVPVILDISAPLVTSTNPADNGAFNMAISSITFNLADAFSPIDFTATLNNAAVRNSFGQGVSGAWTQSGAGQAGVITFAPSSPLSEGIYTAIIYPTDMLGNRSSYTLTFTLDATPPLSPTIDASTPTRNSAKTITGTKSADTSTIVITSSTATIGAVSYPTSTTWSVIVSNLKEGPNTITALAKDAAGNQSQSVSATIVLDTMPPSAPTVNSITSPTKNTSVTLTGTKESGSYLFVNNVQTPVLYADASWSYTVNLNEGNNTITLYSQDEAGNNSAATSVSIVRDTTAPVISSSMPTVNSFTNQAGIIDIVLSDSYSSIDLQESLAGAVVKNSAGTAISGAWTISGSHLIFTPAAALTDSAYTVTLYPVDSLGNKGAASFTFTLDATPPVVQSFTMNPTSPHKAETVTFTVTFNEDMLTPTQPAVSFTRGFFYSTYTATGNWINSRTWQGVYQFTANTGDGQYTVKVSGAKDKAQNTMATQSDWTFILDTTPPDPPTLNAVTTPTKNPYQTISGIKPADTAIIINGAQRVALNTSTTWNYSYPLAEGANNLTITARDEAGNDSIPVAASITLDTTPPNFFITNYQNPSLTQTQTLSGTKEPGCIVKLNNTTIFDANDLNSTWSYTVTLTDGITNRLTFTASDALGNTTTKTVDILYNTTPPPSLAPGVLIADGSGKGNEVTLSWTAYIEPSFMAYYRIYYSTTDFTTTSGMMPIGTVNKGTKTFKATNLTQGTLYYFAAVPVDTSGNADSTVHTASATPVDTAPPEDIANLTAAAGFNSLNGNFIKLNWTASINSMGDLSDQIVYFDNGSGYDAGTSLGKTATAYTKTNLKDAGRYKFKITTKDTLGHESAGVVIEAVTRLNNPIGLTATPANGKASLAWNPVSGQLSGIGGQASTYAKYYNIYRIQSATQQYFADQMTLIKTLSASTTSYTDTGLVNGLTYQYAVTVINTYGAEKTDVASVSAAPRQDSTGPVISGVNITNNQIITAPITIAASAADAESSMGRMEIYIDGILGTDLKSVPTAVGGLTVSYYWNIVGTTDGNHTVKIIAYDSLGNSTELAIPVVVSLAPPSAPTITGHTVVQTTPKYLVNISGTAPAYTTVTLKVSGVVVGWAAPTDQGIFTFTNIALIEGDNFLSANTSHRGGASPFTLDYKITVDTGAPPAPVSLAAKALAGGIVQFTWQNGAGELPSSYNLYASASAFTSKTTSGVTKINTTPITYAFKEYIPADDGLRYYAVTSLDSSGNESPISNVVSIASDRLAPSISQIEYSYNNGAPAQSLTAGPGTVKVNFTISEPLSELPFFSLEPVAGSPIVISTTKIDDTHYTGQFTINAATPHGPTTYKFSGKDVIGNRGSSSGAGLSIDTRGPIASVTSPVTVLQIASTPTEVKVAFDEPPAATPVLELKDSKGISVPVEGAVPVEPVAAPFMGASLWKGSVNTSTLSEGNAEFTLKEAKDNFGNISTKIASGRTILLYKDTVPPPPVPANLTAKSIKGGKITLAWNAVAGAQSYSIYRRAEGESAAATFMVASAVTANTYIDLPPSDGTYYYSITSVGLLNSESAKSAEVSAISDRTPPSPPIGVSVSLNGNGINVAWAGTQVAGVVSVELPASYHLYRSNTSITTTSGLIPVSTSITLTATDPAPSSSMRFYAVTALDALGNESAPSDTVEITFPVAPVKNLILTRIDDGKPTLTWEASESNIQGYFIYRNGSRINQTPTISTAYTDGYYSGGIVKYGISEIDSLGNESPIKEATLPDLNIGLKQGTTLRRGVLETVTITVSSKQEAVSSQTKIDAINIKIGSLPESALTGPFVLSSAAPLEINKVAATEANAPSQIAVPVTAVINPSPGATIKITKTSIANVMASSTALEIYNEPMIRGGQAKVRLKLNNLGSARTEFLTFLTSENNTTTPQVKISLKDQDGNLLAQGYLDQRIGNQIVNSGNYATARLNPGESILTDPITFSVPTSAPYKVIIEAEIQNTYYHYNQPDMVTAPGLKQSAETTITETSYRAIATTDKTIYKQGEQIKITGSAISNTSTSTLTLMPSVPVKLGISVKGFDRYYTINTDNNGNFTYTFTPGSNEAGQYSVWAVHPDINDRTVQAQFSIVGLDMTPILANIKMAKNSSYDIPVTLKNPGDASLTNLTFTATSSSGITAGVINNGDTTLTAGETQNISFRITADSTAGDIGYATMTVSALPSLTTDHLPLTTTLDANLTLIQAIPIISTTPSYIDTGMKRGTQRIESFTITNAGLETLKNARLEGPSTNWMALTNERNIGDIKPGASTIVGIMLKPSETLAQGIYDDRIVIYSDNHIPYTFNIQATVTSSAIGSVMFDVLNELLEDVSGATITIQHQLLTELMYTIKTGVDGTVSLFDIPEGRYSFNVTAPGHKSYSGSFTIQPGITTTVPIGLQVTLIDIQWSVVPITIQDRYEIKITQTFQTNVPVPVLITEPASINIPEMQPGQAYNGEFTVTNYGLIQVDEVNIQFPATFLDYDIEILATIPKTIGAMQKIVVPYRITKRQHTAYLTPSPLAGEGWGEGAISHYSTLLDEVKGYGGSCVTSFSITITGAYVICPNTPQQSTRQTSTGPTIGIPTSCGGTGGTGGGGGTGGYVGGGTYTGGGGGGGGQGGGGWLPGAAPSLLSAGDDECGATDLSRCTGQGCCDVCTSSKVNLSSGTYEDAHTDIEVKTNGMPVQFERYYASRWTQIGRPPAVITVTKEKRDTVVMGGSGGGGGGGSRGGGGTIAAGGLVRSKYKVSVTIPSIGPVPPTQAYGWTSPWFARVASLDGSDGNRYIAYFDGETQVIYFKLNTDGTSAPVQGAERYVAEKGLKLIRTQTQTTLSLTTQTAQKPAFQVKDKTGITKTFVQLGDPNWYRLISIQDTIGNKQTLNYDSQDNLTTITDQTGTPLLTFVYQNGFIAKIQDRDQREVNYTVDARGALTQATDMQGNQSAYQYDQLDRDNFRLLSKTDPENNTTTIQYRQGQLVVEKVIEPGGGERAFNYDFTNRTFYYTDTRGSQTLYTLNYDSKITSITKAGKTIKKIEYLDARTEKTTDEAGNTTTIKKNELFDPISITDGEGNTTNIQYNQYWKIARITDPLNNATQFTYNDKQQITAITYPDSTTTALEYDTYGNITKQTKGKAAETAATTYQYDNRGNVIQITDPNNNATNLGYDQYGHLSTITDTNGNITQITNDIIGRPTQIKDPLGNTKTFTYDKKGNIKTITDEKGNTTTYTYDFKGRITSITDPLNSKTEYQYDGEGNLIKAISNQLSTISYTYDILSRLETITDPEGNITKYEYANTTSCATCGGGNASIPAKIIDPLGNITQNTFDKAGKLTGITDPLGNLTRLAYDAGGRITTRTDANGKITTYEYDTIGRTTKQTDSNNGENTFTYDTRGNLISLTDPNGNTTTFAYDLADRKTKETRPMGQVIEYSYYPNGLLKTVKDSKGQISTYTYDAANRLKEIIYHDGKKDTFTYDAVGNMLTYVKDGVSSAITYDNLNRKLSETINFGAFSKTYSYAYDTAGNKTTFTSPEGTTYAYTYNKNNQPTSITFNGKTINLNYQWDRLIKATLPNGISTDYQYNANSWLNYITTKNATTTLQSSQYAFDKVGNITSKNTEHGNYTYNYDPTYQLTKAINPTVTEEYGYDKTGNRITSANSNEPSAISYTHNANNELTSMGATAYAYDANGNTIQETIGSQITKYIYNTADKLERVELPDGRIANYTYDPFGRRISKTVNTITTYFLYADEGLIGEYGSAGNLKKAYGWMPVSIWGTNPVFMLENGNYYFYHNDTLGTPQKITDINGNIVWSATYTAFGEAVVDSSSTVSNNLRFPGQYFDEETGLHYNNARYYNPKTGRYTQVDPIGFSAGDVNLYRYAFSDPVSLTDPTGEVIDILADIGFIIYDVYRIFKDNVGGKCDNLNTNLTSLGLDIGSAFIPFVSGLGTAYRTEKALAKIAELERIAYLRQKAVREAWKKEKELVERTGVGTRPWSEAEIKELKETGKVKGYEGHHIKSVDEHPNLAGESSNIEFVTRPEHLERHGGDWRNPTTGDPIVR